MSINFHHLDHSADHQKLNVNPKTSISFFDDLGGLFSHFSQVSSVRSLSRSSEVEHNPKLSISFFNDLGGLFSHFSQLLSLRSLNRSSEVEHNQKPTFNFLKIFFSILVGVGGGYIGKCLRFSTFSNCFTLKWLKMIHNGKPCQKCGLDWLKMAILVILQIFPSFPPK